MKQTGYAIVVVLVVFTTIAISLHARHAPVGAGQVLPVGAKASEVPTSRPALVVRIDNFKFVPKELEIAVGGTVTWQNADDVPHTATSAEGPAPFDSGALDTDDRYSFTFQKPGKYSYFCKVHPHMTGVVIVK